MSVAAGLAWEEGREGRTHVVRRAVDVVLEKGIADHVRVVYLSPRVSEEREGRKGAHEDGPEVYKEEERDEEVFVYGEDVGE